ncbi:CPBP family intramembrane metalloprotease domain-containing protein [Vibrio rotiferianus]|uniref:CPBP family intramembrane glutamic endopeptidase n=1 Tax=Vibrio rotiferianus TaxID=190895 RepID=UPI0011108055|nr:type II CAAX endopeptidase family protein [Vibrio rotiferianus]TMX42079.1 CPBP family intramembrane metalloprotease domain-containing protein [Vibrio rotiferianus]TMX57915.1 CPBP family intramembrane metalloprotease domain-containing protein [Vibrio rotiferianus]TMX68280.1 CPBP family intramembrane metalloprotease domain-containing protein [Vibrio rotiferianus]
MILDSAIWLWVPLILAIGAVFFRQTVVALVLLGLTLLSALFIGRIELTAFVSTLVVLGVAYRLPMLASNQKTKPVYYLGWSVVIIWCVMLFVHLIPGFNNLQVLDKVTAGPLSVPFSMYLNLDKPLALFALFLAYPFLLGSEAKGRVKPALLVMIPLLSLLPIAAMLGALKPELSLPSWWWLFALNNLILTCVAEEALFRGFVQQSLSRRFDWRLGLVIASILFGLAHFAGGPLLIVFATLAGLGYGLVFHFTGRLWCAVLAHFLFNFCHLVFFTYPILAR